MRNFKELDIWNESRTLVLIIYQITDTFSKAEQFGLVSQMRRSCVSIASNIAEGCAKESDKDFMRYLQISLGSCYELECQLILANDLKFINSQEFEDIIKPLEILQKRIAKFIKFIASKNKI